MKVLSGASRISTAALLLAAVLTTMLLLYSSRPVAVSVDHDFPSQSVVTAPGSPPELQSAVDCAAPAAPIDSRDALTRDVCSDPSASADAAPGVMTAC